MTEGRERVSIYSLNPLGLFPLKGHLHNRFEGMLLNMRVIFVVHENFKLFAESMQVVRRMATADLRQLTQAISETFDRILRNSSEMHNL